MPQTAPKIQAQLGLSEEDVTYESAGVWGKTPAGVTVSKGETLFPRIDVDKDIEELNRIIAPTAPAAPETPKIEGLAQIGIEEFAKVELRIVEIKACEPIKKAKKLLKLTVDDGAGERTVVSGISKWYKPEDLIGHKVVCVANLKPAVLQGVESCGMLLAADTQEGEVKVLFADGFPTGAMLR